MSVKVRIPAPLRRIAQGKSEVELACVTIGECVQHLEQRYPGFQERLTDETGSIRRFVNIYVNGEDVRFLQGLDTKLRAGDEVSIIPAMAGG